MIEPHPIQTEMHAALGAAVEAWQLIEMALCDVLEAALNTSDPRIASEVFYAVTNFRDKLAMVNAAVHFALERHIAALTRWEKLSEKISKKSKRRNAFVHAHTRIQVSDDGPRVELAPPYRYSQAEPAANQITTVKDIRQSATAFRALAHQTQVFSVLVRGLRVPRL